MSATNWRAPAHRAMLSASAEIERSRNMLVGACTAPQKTLLRQRVERAAANLADVLALIADAEPDPDPIPNVMAAYAERRRQAAILAGRPYVQGGGVAA